MHYFLRYSDNGTREKLSEHYQSHILGDIHQNLICSNLCQGLTTYGILLNSLIKVPEIERSENLCDIQAEK